MLIEKVNDDNISFVAPRYNSTSFKLKHSSPTVVLFEITTQLLPTGHNEVQIKLSPDPDEVYPGKQVHDEAPAAIDEPNGHDEDFEININLRKVIHLKNDILFILKNVNNYLILNLRYF